MNAFWRISGLLMLALSIWACSPSSVEEESAVEVEKPIVPGYEIKVTVNGFSADTMFLAHHMGPKQYIIDTIAVTGTPVVFKGEKALEGGIYLVVLPPENRYFEILLTEGEQYFSVETEYDDLIMKAKFTSSPENDIFYESLRVLNDIGGKIEEERKKLDPASGSTESKEKVNKIIEQLSNTIKTHRLELIDKYPNSFYASILSAMREPEVPENPDPSDSLFAWRYYRAHLFDGLDFSDGRLVRTPILHAKVMQYVDQLTYQHPDSLVKAVTEIIDRSRANDEVLRYVTISLLNKYSKSKIMGQDAVYVSIVEQVYANGDAWWADEEQVDEIVNRAKEISPTLIGGKAPYFAMEDTEGKLQDLYQLPGKYTILYFWDYECGYCKKVTPKMAKLYPKYRDKDVTLLAVSINGDLGIWKEKLGEYGLDKVGALNVQDHARATGFDKYYDLLSTPRIFLLDKDKKIIAKQISIEQLEEMLDDILKEEQQETAG